MKNIQTCFKRLALGTRTSIRFTLARANGSRWNSALLPGTLIAVFALAGCQSKSRSPAQYISPRVEGRVLDARANQPIADVTVQRIDPGQEGANGEVSHGGQLMERAPEVRTGRDGVFTLASERDLELFRRSGWYSVSLSFEHSGYVSFTTNYTLDNATRTASGEPLVKAGDILLQPLSR